MLNQGVVFEAYEIQSIIGSGGFGVVYLGKHRELGIDVAIKEYFPTELSIRQDGAVLPSKPEFQPSFEEGLDRFLEEAKQLEKFRDSPNIVSCRDFFRANGTAYMVMDYISGLPLSSLLNQHESRKNPLTEEDLLNLIAPLLTGLQQIHASGVYHRDIKPSNILVRRTDSVPILIDFGAAKHVTSKYTKSIAPYTDGYAAMEQVGEGKIGPWTDVYGLGAVMWRIVAGGASLHSPPNPIPIQRRAFGLIEEGVDPLPSAEEMGEGRFSNRTLQIIDACLIISVKDRIQNCQELLQKLNQTAILSDKENDPPVNLNRTERQPAGQKLKTYNAEKHIRSPFKRPKSLIRGALLIGAFLVITSIILVVANQQSPTDTNDTQQGIQSSSPTSPVESRKQSGLSTETNNAESQTTLGSSYSESTPVVENDSEDLESILLAAEQGNVGAQDTLGILYANGWGVTQSYEDAMKWFLLAAEQGYANAQNKLGDMYKMGYGVPEDPHEAAKWYKLAAEQGLPEAQFNFGVMHDFGQGVPLNNQEAVNWYRLAAEQGYAKAQLYLGGMYQGGEGVTEDPREAIKWYRLAAEQGNAQAQLNLGRRYDNGDGIEADDQEAVKWYRLAADQGLPRAQFNLGLMYDFGEGVTRSDREAAKWYDLAAEQGLMQAQFAIGTMYDGGRGVPLNDMEAARWYRLAGEQGFADAQYYLGLMYTDGEGVPADFLTAYAWISLAALGGHRDAIDLERSLRSQMTPEQLSEAQRQSSIIMSRIESANS